jgi:hypothetical protein
LQGNYNMFERESTEVEHGSDSCRVEEVGGLFHIVRRKQQLLKLGCYTLSAGN